MLPLQGVWVPSLGKKLRSHTGHIVAKKKKENSGNEERKIKYSIYEKRLNFMLIILRFLFLLFIKNFKWPKLTRGEVNIFSDTNSNNTLKVSF